MSEHEYRLALYTTYNKANQIIDSLRHVLDDYKARVPYMEDFFRKDVEEYLKLKEKSDEAFLDWLNS